MSDFQYVNLGTGPDTYTGDPLYDAFSKINLNFADIAAGNANITITAPVQSVAGRQGNIILYVNDVLGAASIGYVNSLAFGNATISVDNVTGAASVAYVDSLFANANVTVNAPVQSVNGLTGNVILTVANIANAASTSFVTSTVNNAIANLNVNIAASAVSSVAGRTGNIDLTVNDVLGAASIGYVNSLAFGNVSLTVAEVDGAASITYVNSLFANANIVLNAPVQSVNGLTGNVVLTVANIAGAASTSYVDTAIATGLSNVVVNVAKSSVTTVAGRTGNVVLTVNDVLGAASIGYVNSLLGTGEGIGQLQANIDLINSNVANLTASLANIDSEQFANIAILYANAAIQADAISVLYGNAIVQESEIANIVANVTTISNELANLSSDRITANGHSVVVTADGALNLPANGVIRNSDFVNGPVNIVSNTYAQLQWTANVGSADPNSESGNPTNWVYLDSDGFNVENIAADGTNLGWHFNDDGSLTLPAYSGQIGRAGYTNGMDLFNSNGGTGYVRMNFNDQSAIWVDPGGAYLQTGGGTVTLDNTGVLTTPGNVFVSGGVLTNNYYYANGQPFISTTLANTADIVANTAGGYDVGLSLTSTGVVAGTYGSAVDIPTITVDSKGRITSLTTNAISTTLSLAGTSGTGTVDLLSGALTFAGQYGVTATASGNIITISTPQDLQTTASPSFTGLTLTGSNNATGIGTGTLIVDGGASVQHDLWVGGNVYAMALNTITSSILQIDEPLLYLTGSNPYPYNFDLGFYSHFVGGPANVYAHTGLVRNYLDNEWYLFSNIATEPAGNVINLSSSSIIYDTLKLGGANLANTTISTSTTTGALIVGGGAGIAGNLYVGNNLNVSGVDIISNVAGLSTAIVTANTSMKAYVDAQISTEQAQLTAINVAIANVSGNVTSVQGNTITLGSNTTQALVSNAVTLTTSTKVTDAIAELNYVLGKLVPPSPPNFPNNTTISVPAANSGLMCNFTQTDNSGWGNLSVAGGTLVGVVRASSFSTSGTAVTNVGPGNTGTVTAYINGVPNGNITLTGSNGNTTNGNLYVYSVQDYHNVVSTVTAGFWTVFSTYATATGGMLPGWNRVSIYDSGTGTATNDAKWYYDNATPSAPAFSGTSMVLSSNVVQYSSTIPMFTTSAGFTLKGNVQNISGDTYPNSTNLISSSSANGAFAAPALVSYATAGVTTPITRNNTAVIAFTTTSNINSGFGNALGTAGPSVTVNNSYNSTSWGFSAPATYILYKTGTGTSIEETAITNTYTGGSAAYRIANPDAGTAADTPAYTGSEAAFNSQTGPFYTTDATNVAAKIQYDQTNYSTGFLPVGPNLSGRSTSQYFTFKFVKGAVSKFNISYSGTIAGLWVALPGSSIDTTAAPTNGWLNMGVAYAGSGIPGTGTGGNGSTGCSTGGTAVLNSLVSGGSYTCTFGTTSSTSSTGNEIYVRVKLTSGQSLTALSIANPTN